jgi:hypothetical protein
MTTPSLETEQGTAGMPAFRQPHPALPQSGVPISVISSYDDPHDGVCAACGSTFLICAIF